MPYESYTPLPVPDTQSPDLERYIDYELNQVAELKAPRVETEAGALYVTAATGVVGLGALIPFDAGFDSGRVMADTTADTLTIEEPGLYLLNFVAPAEVGTGSNVVVQLHVNGVAQPTFSGTISTSNQNAYGTFVFTGLVPVLTVPGVLDVRVTTGSINSVLAAQWWLARYTG